MPATKTAKNTTKKSPVKVPPAKNSKAKDKTVTPVADVFKKVEVPLANGVCQIDQDYKTAIEDSINLFIKDGGYDVSENMEMFDEIKATFFKRFSTLEPKVKKVIKEVKGGGKAKSAKKPAKKSGYSLYITHRFAENKDDPQTDDDGEKLPATVLMGQFAKAWKSLSDEEKQPWLNKAIEANAKMEEERANSTEESVEESESSSTETKAKKPKVAKAMTGYSLFSKKHHAWFKEQNPDEDFGGLSKLKGAHWKSLSKTQQDEYTTEGKQMFEDGVKDVTPCEPPEPDV